MINSGEIYLQSYSGKCCSSHVDINQIQSFRERLKRAPSIIILGTDASGTGGERWAFVAYREKNRNRTEIHRDRGFNEGFAGPTPAEGIAVIKALEWAISMIEKGIIFPDEFIKVGSDNSAVFTKMLGEGRVFGKYDEIWQRIEELCRMLKDRLILEIDSDATKEADHFAQLMPGDPRN